MKLADWIILMFVVIALITLWLFKDILLIVFTAIVTAVGLNSLVRWIRSFGIPKAYATPMALGLVFLVGLLSGTLVIPPFLAQFNQLLTDTIPQGYEQLVEVINSGLENPPFEIPEETQELFLSLPEWFDRIGPLAQRLSGNLFEFFSNTLTTLLQLLLVFVLTLMFFSDPQAYRQTMVSLFPAFYRERADEIFSKCEIALISWMRGIAINSMFIATLSGIGLSILQIDFVLAHALLAGLFNFIPNIGPTLSVVFPLSVALLDAPWKALAVLILYVVIQNLESYWFSPMVMQKQVSLLPAATLIAQIFFATFFGVVGLVLALPLAVVTKTWIEEAWIHDYLNRLRGQRDSHFSPAPETVQPIRLLTRGQDNPPDSPTDQKFEDLYPPQTEDRDLSTQETPDQNAADPGQELHSEPNRHTLKPGAEGTEGAGISEKIGSGKADPGVL